MTVYSRLVRLRAPQNYSKKFKSRTKRVDVIWYPYNKNTGEQYAQLIATNKHPVIGKSGVLRHIDEELNYMPVCQDAVRERKNSPKGPLHNVSTIVGHPGLQGDRDFLKSTMSNIRDKWITKDKLYEINAKMKSLGYKKGIEIEEVKHHPTRPIALYKIKLGEIETG